MARLALFNEAFVSIIPIWMLWFFLGLRLRLLRDGGGLFCPGHQFALFRLMHRDPFDILARSLDSGDPIVFVIFTLFFEVPSLYPDGGTWLCFAIAIYLSICRLICRQSFFGPYVHVSPSVPGTYLG